MIVFYNKITGNIEGTIQGRFHSPAQRKMWIGNPAEIGRIIVPWKPFKFYDEKGKILKDKKGNVVKTKETLKKIMLKMSKKKKKKKKFYNADFEPDHPQKDIFSKLDKKPREIKKYKVNPKTKELKLK